MAPPTIMRVPSVSLLRAFLKPLPAPCTQFRSKSNWMPRERFAKTTRLDKLHRQQKAALRQEKLDSHTRGNAMPPPSFLTPTPTPLESNLDALPSAVPPSQPASSSLPYAISRTSSGLSSLPIYESTKAGGSLHITTIRKCSGDLSLLQSHLLDALRLEASFLDKKGKKKENVKINPLTKQIVVRGWRGAEVRRWCEMVGF